MTNVRTIRRVWLLSLLLAVACQWGVRPGKFSPAVTSRGAHVTLRVRGDATLREGELYVVDSVGVVIRAEQLTRVAWTRLADVDVAQEGSEFDMKIDDMAIVEKRARLALVSRFPYGLSREMQQRVLARIGQRDIAEVR